MEVNRELGDIIRRYRESKSWTQSELARKLRNPSDPTRPIDPSTINRIENGERGISLELFRQLDSVLAFEGEDRDALIRAAGIDDLTEELIIDNAIERTIREKFEASLRLPIISEALANVSFLREWGIARIYLLRVDIGRSIPLFERLISQLPEDSRSELWSIICLDMADALIHVGDLDRALHFAKRSETICQEIQKARRSHHTTMGLARAIVMQQEIACVRGDRDTCWRLHEAAIEHLEKSSDTFGWVKSLYFLALFHFWNEDFAQAQDYAKQMLSHLDCTRIRLDPWFWIRDGLFLSSHWWLIHTYALLCDLLSLAPNVSDTDARTYGDKLDRERRVAFWAREIVPFMPRYSWLRKGADEDKGVTNDRFGRLVRTSYRLNYHMYLPEMLVSWGDFLRRVDGDETTAREKYSEAQAVARTHGLGLLGSVAANRLQMRTARLPKRC